MTRPPDGPVPPGSDPDPVPGGRERPAGERPDASGRSRGQDDAAMQVGPGEPHGDGLGAQPEPEPEPGRETRESDAPHNPSLSGLSKTLRRGATISAAMLFVTQVISLAQTVVVARLLSPTEIGVFTLGTLFANFLVALAGGGMKAALIQREYEIEEAANTAFWASVATGVGVSTAALLGAPLLGMFFDDQLVGLIAAVTSGTLLIHALLNVPDALMQRRFNFKRKLIIDPITAGSFAVVTVTAAALGFGVWGMVAGLYASQVATLIAVWALARWRPGKAGFSFRIWREMAKFAFPLIIQGVAGNFREIAQQAIVGRALDIPTAGQYRYGRRIGTLPGQAIIQVASYVLFPAFARISADAVRFKRGFLRALRLLWTATIPVAGLLIAVGGPAIVVLLGQQWAPAGVFVAAMAGFGPGTAMNAVAMESIKGAGRSKLLNWITAASLVIGIGALVLLLPLGLFGVGLAVSIDGVVVGLLSLALAAPIVGVTWPELGRVMVPPTLAAAIAGGATWALENLLLDSDSRPIVVGLLFLLLDLLVFAVIYLGTLALVAPATIVELRDLVQKFLRRRAGGGGGGEPTGDATTVSDPDDPSDPTGVLARRGEDDLLDAPTVILRLGGLDPQTQRLVQMRASRPPTPPARPRPSGPARRPGPPPGPPPDTRPPNARPPDARPPDARPPDARPPDPRPPAAPAPYLDPPTTAIPARPDTTRAGRSGRPGATSNGNGNGNGNGTPGNGTPGNGVRGNGTDGHGPHANGTNGHGAHGRRPDGADASGEPRESGPRRVVPMTEVTDRRPPT